MSNEISQREILCKTLVWRFAVAIPLSVMIAMFFVDDWIVSIEISIFSNIASTIFYYIYEVLWGKIWHFLSNKKKS